MIKQSRGSCIATLSPVPLGFRDVGCIVETVPGSTYFPKVKILMCIKSSRGVLYLFDTEDEEDRLRQLEVIRLFVKEDQLSG